jgi:hypothetical protein
MKISGSMLKKIHARNSHFVHKLPFWLFIVFQKISDQKPKKPHFNNISRMKGNDFIILYQSVY